MIERAAACISDRAPGGIQSSNFTSPKRWRWARHCRVRSAGLRPAAFSIGCRIRSRMHTRTFDIAQVASMVRYRDGVDDVIFRGLFGGRRGDAEAPALPVVRNITIGRSVRLDPLAWRRLGTEAVFQLQTDTLSIVAQGRIDLGADGWVHRFYTEDDLMLQMVSPDAEGQGADDVTLFMPWASAFPPDAAAKRRWADRLRARSFGGEGLPDYKRFWFGDTDERQDPVSFWENVYDDRAGSVARRIYQTCMLFARDLPGEGRELLLAIEMEPEGGDLTHEIMVGIPLNLGEFEA